MGGISSHNVRRSFVLKLVITAIGLAPSNGQDLQNFAVGLYNNVAKTNQIDKNIAISPFSADAALSMTFLGAAGTTKSELASTLGINDNTAGALAQKFKSVNAASKGFTLKSANGIFVEKTFPILPAFSNQVVSQFGASISSVNFAGQLDVARQEINSFVGDKTNNKIKDFLPAGSVQASTKLILVNAVYFKADWEHQFDKFATTIQPFTLSNGLQKNSSLMQQTTFFTYAESPELGGAQLLELPYKGLRHAASDTSMVVILPKTESGLQGLENRLTPASLDAALNKLSGKRVEAYLPKFKITTGLMQLAGSLKAIGIKAAFSASSDFSGITSGRGFQISEVLQKVFIAVDEEGTEAAAATAVMMMGASLFEEEPVTFRADRPFLYLIRHKPTNSILFMGRLADPTVAN